MVANVSFTYINTLLLGSIFLSFVCLLKCTQTYIVQYTYILYPLHERIHCWFSVGSAGTHKTVYNEISTQKTWYVTPQRGPYRLQISIFTLRKKLYFKKINFSTWRQDLQSTGVYEVSSQFEFSIDSYKQLLQQLPRGYSVNESRAQAIVEEVCRSSFFST